MPFQSEKQRRFLHANHPEIAKRWERDYANGGISNHFRRKYFSGAYGQGAGDRGGDPHASRAENVASSFTSVGKGGHTNNNTPPTHPIHTGPTAAELAARKAAADAKAKAIAQAEYKNWWDATKEKKKEKVSWKDKLETFGNKLTDYTESGLALSTVPFNFTKALFGNVKDPEALTTATLTDAMREDLISKAKAKGTLTGNIDYTDYGVKDKSFIGLNKDMKALDIANALTMGGTNFTTDESGNITFTGDKYDLGDENVVAQFIDEGGLMGASKKLGEKIYDWTHEAAKGGIARKNYFHGGILDINESEEIISDDGNDIELTAYNAAFDDPNDLSTGVKSLFRAKDGGTPRRSYFTGAYGVGGTENENQGNQNTGGNTAREQGIQDYHSRVAETAKENKRQQDLRDIVATGPGSDVEKYDSYEQMLQDKYPGQGADAEKQHFNIQKSKVILNKARDDWEEVRNSMDEKYKKKAGSKIIRGLLMGGVTFGIGDIIGVMIDGFKTNKAKQEFIGVIQNQIANYTTLGMPVHSPHTDTLIQTLNQEILDLTQRPDEDDPGHDPVPIYDPTTGAVSEEYAQGDYDIDQWANWNAMKQKQLLNAQLQEQWRAEKEAYDQSFLVANSGGLANLFRVKNQY